MRSSSRPSRCVQPWNTLAWTMARSACTTRCTHSPWLRSLRSHPWRGSSAKRASRASSHASGHARRGDVRLPGSERMLAARRHRVRPNRWAQVRDLPAHRRPLPLRGGVPRRWGETSAAAITVFDKAVAAHGVPQRLLSDNGALDPSRRGVLGQLVVHVMALGVERSPASPSSRPPRARTSGSIRPCSATSTSSRWLRTWLRCKPRSRRSTRSTTPASPSRAPGRVTPQPHGKQLRKPRHPARP